MWGNKPIDTRNCRLIVLLASLLIYMALVDRSLADDFSVCSGVSPPRLDEQISACTRLLASGNLNGDRTRILSSRGTAYSQSAQYDKAILDFSNAIRLSPRYRYAYEWRGYSYMRKNLYNQAILDFSIALGLDPKLSNDPTGAMVYATRGGAYLATNQLSLARANLQEAVKVGKDVAVTNLARQGILEVDRITSIKANTFADKFNKAIEFAKAHWLLTSASLVVMMLAIRRWRSTVRGRRYHALIDMADDWFREHKIDPSSLTFNAYSKAVLVKNRNAVAFVGSGQSTGERKGFVIEVDQKIGVVDGLIVSTSAASWSRLKAKRGRLYGISLISQYMYEIANELPREVPEGSSPEQKKGETQSPGAIVDQTIGSEGESLKLHGNMPDVVNSKPVSVFRCDRYLLYLLKNPKMITETITGDGGDVMKYPFSLAALDAKKKRMALFVNVEESMFGTRMLGVFDVDGVHHNRGPIGKVTQDEFLDLAVKVFRDSTGCSAALQKVSLTEKEQ